VNDSGNWFRTGRSHALQILILEPLFEEANRCRRLIAEMMRALDTLGIGSTLPFLPGTGESVIDIADVSLADWRQAVATAAEAAKPVVIASLRGGSLIDGCGAAMGYWRFATETGTRIVRDLRRTQLSGETGLYAGHRLSDKFLAELEAASPPMVMPLRTVRLDRDAQPADALITGSPLWRRAEPGEDAALATVLAHDLAAWVKQCAAS
jgi:hypothetical protein